MKLPIGPSDYYESYPSIDHRAGDIWIDLPTHGILGPPRLPGVVVTPACDLINRKVETLTYLPIVRIRDYLTSRSCLTEILRATRGQLELLGLQCHGTEGANVPHLHTIETVKEKATERLRDNPNAKETTAGHRAMAGLRLLSALQGQSYPNVDDVRSLLGEKEFSVVKQRLVTNAHRSDVHFLPPDGQTGEWAALKCPSVALFRYPLSIPMDILDLAQTVIEESWAAEVTRLGSLYPCVEPVRSVRPMKVLRIQPRFLSDLLTRFVGLYGRIGSPDFSPQSIERYVTDIEANS